MKKLTTKELKERAQEINEAIKKSNSVLNNFRLHFAIFRSPKLAQVSLLTEEEYLNMQKDANFKTPHLQKFLNSLQDYSNINTETLTIDSSNYALAFNPAIWSILKLEQKIAICRLACIKINDTDITKYENYNSNGFIFVGDEYKGAFNIGAFYREDRESVDFLKDIYNFNNTIKFNYYINNSKKREYNSIFDFESFEEMQYLSPLEPNDNLKDSSNEVKAFFWDQLFRRSLRKAILQTNDAIMDVSQPLLNITPDFYSWLKTQTKEIVDTNVFVATTLGSNKFDRDRKYLHTKVDIFNHILTKEYNQVAEKYNQLIKSYNESNNKNNVAPMQKEMKKLQQQMKEIDNNIITYEQAEEHFKQYFNKKTYTTDNNKENDNEEMIN